MNRVGFCFIAGMLILVPFGLYTYTFGTHLSETHQRWAEFGSFYGGIVGPMLTLATVIFLYYQLRLQNETKIDAATTQDIQRLKADVDYYAQFIASELSKPMPGMDDKRLLRTHISQTSAEINHCFIYAKEPLELLKSARLEVSTLFLCHGNIFISWLRINEDLVRIETLGTSLKNKRDDSVNQKIKISLVIGEIECSHMDTLFMTYNSNFEPRFRPNFVDTYNKHHKGRKTVLT